MRPASPTLLLTTADRARTPDPAKPSLPQPLAPTYSAEATAERAYLFEAVVKPLLVFSLAQEAAKQAEGQRADGLVAKVDAHNAVVAPEKRSWWPFSPRDRKRP
ncbi:hypothetical protein V7S57_02530 [Caulobacter sp. CCNWLY153]|uniref:hypothetical protein n=1 Tax=unclassified Caulobacter TaxID=2648921 RepID=UPI002FF2E92C